jgi:hypothetical protein
VWFLSHKITPEYLECIHLRAKVSNKHSFDHNFFVFPVKISKGETFLDHSELYSQNRIFDEALVMKSRMFRHAPDTIFMGFQPVFGTQTVVKLIITCSK